MSFRPVPGGMFTIVECAVAAYVVTELAPDYRTFLYLSVWYVRMLFKTLRRPAAAPMAYDGPACERAGM